MSPRLFGTDGIRGVFGEPPLDRPTVARLGRVLGERLARERTAPRVALGGDTRESTPSLCRWLAAGLGTAGAEPVFLGTVPTPAVAAIVRKMGLAAGVAVSASHNLPPDNGIKLFDGAGFKWSPEAERELEEALETVQGDEREAALPELEVASDRVEAYLDTLVAAVGGGQPFAGLHVALDAANGAASPFAGALFERLGARVSLAHAEPDGENVNRGCGSTHPEVIAELTRRSGADLGFAFDGDADRVILADETGEVRDGDVILYLWARELRERGELKGKAIVATSMSNLGLEVASRRHGIELVRCDVGDREVVRTLVDRGLELGGEQSGHVIYLPLATTGDGLATALQMALLRARSDRPLSSLAEGFERFPQLIRNVRVASKPPLENLPRTGALAREIEVELGKEGRLVLRYSGTEPLARIMLEGRDQSHIEELAEKLARAIEDDLRASSA